MALTPCGNYSRVRPRSLSMSVGHFVTLLETNGSPPCRYVAFVGAAVVHSVLVRRHLNNALPNQDLNEFRVTSIPTNVKFCTECRSGATACVHNEWPSGVV